LLAAFENLADLLLGLVGQDDVDAGRLDELSRFVGCAQASRLSRGCFVDLRAGADVPDLALGASPLASVAAAPLAVATGAETPELTAAVGLAAVALLFATGASVVRRFEVLVDPWASSVWVRALPVLLGAGAAASAIALSRHGVDAENILRLGLGLGASAWAAPHLVGDRRGAAVGAIVGSVAFAGLSLMAAVDPHGLVALPALAVAPAPALPALAVIAFPALAAAPLAALAAALARSRPRRARAARPARAAPLGCSPEGTLPQ